MSTEDDIATIQQVTDQLAGPIRVWVLHISGEGIDDLDSLHYTFEGLKAAARRDMTTNFKPPRPQAEIDGTMRHLTTHKFAQLDLVYYTARLLEIGE